MVTIEMQFPAGRYHATPWGSHVNEGLVEWPPCPWRLLRAFIATGFSKLGWEEGVPDAARQLIEKLAAVLPEYRLPRGEVGHSRHYMPIAAGSGETTTKVFDTFVRLRDDDPLLVRYPVELSTAERELLKSLVEPISYLGRAESWLDARLGDDGIDPPSNDWCRPTSNGTGPAPGGDQVTLLAALSSQDYAQWRAQSFPSESPTDKSARGKKSSKSAADKAWPSDLLDCLCADTAFLQKHGWSQPPGSRRVLYNRPSRTLEPRPARNPRRQRHAPSQEAALLSLASDTVSGNLLPLMTRCVRQAEFIHDELVRILTNVLQVTDCPCLFGKDRNRQKLEAGHQHAHYLPLDLDDDGRLDHILIHAPMGLDENAQRAITRLRHTWTKNNPNAIFVTCAGFGDLGLFRRQLRTAHGKEIGIIPATLATVWESCTPYVPARHLKPRNDRYTLEDDVRRELAARPHCISPDVAESVKIEVLGQPGSSRAKLAKLLRFVRARQPGSQQPPKPIAFGVRLSFTRPITGPISLGYGSHFGLGLFAPP